MHEKKHVFRQVVNTLNLWVGVPSASVLFIVCLTGTMYVFQKEIIRWMDSDKYKINSTGNTQSPVSLDILVSSLESQYSGLKVTVVQIPEKSNEAWLFTLAPLPQKDAEAEKAAIKKNTKMLLVNPYSGLIQGNAHTTAYRFFETVIELHRWLLMDHDVGAVITGTAAFLFLLLEITGLILWLPAKLKSWKKWNAWKPGTLNGRQGGNAPIMISIKHWAFILFCLLPLWMLPVLILLSPGIKFFLPLHWERSL